MHQAPPTPPAQEAMAAPQGQFLHSSPSAVHPMREREKEGVGIGGQTRADFFKSLRESAKSAVRALFADFF